MTLNVQTRQIIGKKVKKLRQENKIPAVLYGHKIKNQNLVLNYNDFEKAFNQIGESSLLDLKISNKDITKVLIHNIARHPVTNKILNIDFYQVRMDEKIKTEVILNFVNEAPAVKDLNGILIKTLDYIEIECLPKDLISEINIDLSKLKNFNDMIKVSDLQIPTAAHILTDPNTTIVLVKEPRKSEEEKPKQEEKPAKEKEGEEKEGEERKSKI